MAWIQKLYETYENNQHVIGQSLGREVPLLPICHTTQMAQVEITLDAKGAFRRARVVPKVEARTIIPCTEKSAGRTSGEAPHPLCDKLQYIAKEYEQYGGSKSSYFGSYTGLLGDWAASDPANAKLKALFAYLQKGSLMQDLIDSKVLLLEKTKLLKKWDKKEDAKPPIFDVLASQEDAFIRWVIEIPGDAEPRVWQDPELWKSWIDYYSSIKQEKAFCYVTGTEEFAADQHLAKIRNDGDKAKLISSNDSSGFTFRGRFLSSEQAASVGFRTTQKAHLALRWLISRQGYRKGDLAIVAWAPSGSDVDILQPTDDILSLVASELSGPELTTASTAQDVALRLKKKIAGYRASLGDTNKIVVMALDSATPGRMAITYYRELDSSEFLKKLDEWHESAAWLHHYGFGKEQNESGKAKTYRFSFVGAPAPNDIAEAAYGPRVDENLRKLTIQRLLPCIIDGAGLPRDLVEASVRRACSRMGKDKWEWNKNLTIACALYRKSKYGKEDYKMTLDPERKTRDYLYGRLLALADSLEEWALNVAGERRETNAARLMQRFAERPYSTWRTIELALTPYKARLGSKSKKRQQMIDQVISSFDPDEFINDRRLSGEFLLGYHSQRESLRQSSDNNLEADTSDEEN